MIFEKESKTMKNKNVLKFLLICFCLSLVFFFLALFVKNENASTIFFLLCLASIILFIYSAVSAIKQKIKPMRKSKSLLFDLVSTNDPAVDNDSSSDADKKETDKYNGNFAIGKFPDFTIIDLETTGLDPVKNEIIELGAAKVRNGQIVNTYQQLVRPKKAIPAEIENMTGISNDMVADAPAISDVIGEYVDFIGDDIVIGHNVKFDLSFLSEKLKKAKHMEFTNDYSDTMLLARRVMKGLVHYKLQDLVKHYKIKPAAAHRSLADCISTFDVYKKLCADVGLDWDGIVNQNYINVYRVHAPELAIKRDIGTDSPITGKIIVFTAELARMEREDAQQLVESLGGINHKTVVKNTDYLVVGSAGYSHKTADDKSTKWKKAAEWISKGVDIQIIGEDDFFAMICQ